MDAEVIKSADIIPNPMEKRIMEKLKNSSSLNQVSENANQVQLSSFVRISPEPDILFKGAHHVLEKVLEYLDFSSLKHCRLVSHRWNSIATKISQDMPNKTIKMPEIDAGGEQFTEFINTIIMSEHPEWMFSSLSTSATAVRIPEILKDVLQKLGKFVKTLGLICQTTNGKPYTYRRIQAISQFLECCPNIIELKLSGEIDSFFISFPIWLKPNTLKLQTVSIDSLSAASEKLRTYIFHLLDNSPDLKVLELIYKGPKRLTDPNYHYYRNHYRALYENFRFYPSIAPKLEEFICDVLVCPIEGMTISFTHFLWSKVNLKYLTIMGCSFFAGSFLLLPTWNDGRPQMGASLKELTLSTLPKPIGPPHIGNCSTLFPNLEKLTVSNMPAYKFEIGLDVCKQFPFLKLKVLKLNECYSELVSELSVNNFIQSFPNLEILELCCALRECICLRGGKCSDLLYKKSKPFTKLDKIIHALAKLPKLKKLEVWTYLDDKIQLTNALLSLPKYKCLESLCIVIVTNWICNNKPKNKRHMQLLAPEQATLRTNWLHHLHAATKLKTLKKLDLVNVKVQDGNGVYQFAAANKIPLNLLTYRMHYLNRRT